MIDDVIVIDNPQSIEGFRDAQRVLNAVTFDVVVHMIDVGVPWRRWFEKMLLAAALVGLTCQVGWRRRVTTEFGKVPATTLTLGNISLAQCNVQMNWIMAPVLSTRLFQDQRQANWQTAGWRKI